MMVVTEIVTIKMFQAEESALFLMILDPKTVKMKVLAQFKMRGNEK